ncbi:MAG TPA: DUF1488 family protein [Burkholderiaceae bacterium]|nr:DUF1488 family protein [Burkholderiaceae bacterium]
MGEFAKQTQAKYEDGCIRFTLDEGGQQRKFEISGDALLQAFEARDGTANALLEAFENGRDQIVSAARTATVTPTAEGVIVLGSGDFEAKNARGGISPGERGGSSE